MLLKWNISQDKGTFTRISTAINTVKIDVTIRVWMLSCMITMKYFSTSYLCMTVADTHHHVLVTRCSRASSETTVLGVDEAAAPLADVAHRLLGHGVVVAGGALAPTEPVPHRHGGLAVVRAE